MIADNIGLFSAFQKKKGEIMMKYLLILMIPLMVFSVGCGKAYTVGTPIEKAKVDQIVPGTTSEANVVEMFGQPAKKETVAPGGMKYVYNYYSEEPKVWTKNVVQKTRLEVFTKDGVVQRYEIKKEGVDSVSQ